MSAQRKPTHCERVLELLGDGNAHTHLEIYALGVVCHSRISELRRRGYVITTWHDSDPRTSERLYWHQLDAIPEQGAAALRGPAPRTQLDDVEEIFGSPGEGEASVAVFPVAVAAGEDAIGGAGASSPDPVQLTLEAA